MIHLFDHCGVLLSVDYIPGHPVHFNSVRVTDGDYKPVGPNLLGLLHHTLVPLSDLSSGMICQTFLSTICDDLEAQHGPD